MAPVAPAKSFLLDLETNSTGENLARGHIFNQTVDTNNDFPLKEMSDAESDRLTTWLTSSQEDYLTPSTLSPPLNSSDFFHPSLVSEDKMDNIQRAFYNNSKVISDLPEYSGLPHTPLTAPELDLVNVDRGTSWTDEGGFLYLDSAHTEELAWLIPAAIVVIFIFFVIAYVCYYGVRSLEMKLMKWCFKTCGCCRPGGSHGSGDETDALTSNIALHQTEVKAYQSNKRWSRDSDDFML